MRDFDENPWGAEPEPGRRLLPEGLIYRLPFYVLLPGSILLFAIDSSLWSESGGA